MKTPTLLLSLSLLLAGCGGDATATNAGAAAAGDGPLVFVALDQDFSGPMLESFAKELGFPIRQQYDTENAKTVSLVSRLLAEKNRPTCDVFWNNELAHTVHLAEEGLLAPYVSPNAADVPAQWRDKDGRWTGFAARARVLIVNTDLLPDPKTWPTSYKDLVDPKWKGRCAVARPLTGTTMTHFTALRLALGDQAFDTFFTAMEKNEVRFVVSNGAVMHEVRDGKLAWGFTDTDDYHTCKQNGFPVACVFPDQEEGGIGTMLIPNSVGIVANCPHPEQAKKLVDRILARSTEAALAAADGAQIPLREGVAGPQDPAIQAVGKFRAMQWDPAAVAKNLANCSRDFGKRFGM